MIDTVTAERTLAETGLLAGCDVALDRPIHVEGTAEIRDVRFTWTDAYRAEIEAEERAWAARRIAENEAQSEFHSRLRDAGVLFEDDE